MSGETRGLEWNILTYRIVNDLVFNAVIGKIDEKCTNPFNKNLNRFRVGTLIKITLFCLVLIAANSAVFIQVKQPNLFEQLGVSRACTEAEIDATYESQAKQLQHAAKGYFAQQAQVKQKELIEIRDLLKNNARRIIYDKFGITEQQYAYFITPSFMMQTILQTGISYLILLIASIAGTNTQQKSVIKWQVLLIITFFMLEISTIQSDSTQADYVDTLFPSLTIQQRIHFLKFLLVPVSIIVGYITQKLTPNRTSNMALKLSYLKDEHLAGFLEDITKVGSDQGEQSSQDQGESEKSNKKQTQAKQMVEDVKEAIHQIDQSQELITSKDAKKGYDIGSIMKFLVFGYLIYSQVQ